MVNYVNIGIKQKMVIILRDLVLDSLKAYVISLK